MKMSSSPLALTLGDPAGIGPDITLAAWHARHAGFIPSFVLLGDPDVIAARAKLLGVHVPIAVVEETGKVAKIFADALPVLPLRVPVDVVPGQPSAEAGPVIQHSIERAVTLVREGGASAVVTNPISKAVLYAAGFSFPGHTEFLGALAGSDAKHAPVMMLIGGDLRVVPVTIHTPLKEVPAALNEALILSTLKTTADGLRRYFGIEHPRLSVSGLNPHAGEEGGLGREEIEIIAPAIARARSAGLDVAGPLSADTMFHAEARRRYDAAIAMYHDQALIPIKTLAFDSGVNVTLGLPFVRTSPDHGTAFSIAGTGAANPSSLIEALKLAHAMAERRAGRTA